MGTKATALTAMPSSPVIGTSVPRGEAGRGTSVGVDGTPVQCQFYWTPDPGSSDPSDVELLEALRPSKDVASEPCSPPDGVSWRDQERP